MKETETTPLRHRFAYFLIILAAKIGGNGCCITMKWDFELSEKIRKASCVRI